MSHLFRRSEKKEEGGDTPNRSNTDHPVGTAGTREPSTSQAEVPAPKRSIKSRFGDKIRAFATRAAISPMRSTTPRALTPTPATVSDTQVQITPSLEAPESVNPGSLLSKPSDISATELAKANKKEIRLLKLGANAIDLLKVISDTAGLALPNPVGAILEKVSGVLGILKVCSTDSYENQLTGMVM